MKSMKVLVSFLIGYIFKSLCMTGVMANKDSPPAGQKQPGPTQGSEQDKLVDSGCNFSARTDMGVSPFSSIKKTDDEMCMVKTNDDVNTFLYSCDGVSEPATCPEVVKVDDSDVDIKTLFTQATCTDKTSEYGGIRTFQVLTGKAQREFTAKCVCTKADGKSETMTITSSFGKVNIFAVVGILFLVALGQF
ncbi:conserved hypothetical protein [Theileria equi strain WA]|uniref:Signal peptide containing protein n=1 Tax=Theileria equi strain WA TaxID=1537102 RepID=L1LF28_THEEQ|nr:conserved hypothetical protein [Theileria equi strain WA]EKX74047.1 conserved hypothetical protein [Theileria equi strain WA]|eukprot:XP_004833499.1 conserved hypothetical protein [Theileria equi strain WA]